MDVMSPEGIKEERRLAPPLLKSLIFNQQRKNAPNEDKFSKNDEKLIFNRYKFLPREIRVNFQNEKKKEEGSGVDGYSPLPFLLPLDDGWILAGWP